MRKLATIRKIDEIRPIEGADAIECAVVGGWIVVVKKNEFEVGEKALYIEIDSWVPTRLAPFLSKGQEPREYNGVKGERLRTVKLRGQLSQGLLLPFPEVGEEGQDLSELLGIQKWEAPVPAQLAGQVRGNFPTAVPKTDQERVQNITRELAVWMEAGDQWEVTEKLDGSSCTFFLDAEGELHVCSRNLDLKFDENNSFWKMAVKYDVREKMVAAGLLNFAIQGELIGEGVQGNPYNIKGQDFYVFDMYSVGAGKYVVPTERHRIANELGLNHVPVVAHTASLVDTLGLDHVNKVLQFAEAKSALNQKTEREGVVFKHVTGQASFKAISNAFLLRKK